MYKNTVLFWNKDEHFKAWMSKQHTYQHYETLGVSYWYLQKQEMFYMQPLLTLDQDA
jgi:4'-phosphopantetheinyl transferase EntD